LRKNRWSLKDNSVAVFFSAKENNMARWGSSKFMQTEQHSSIKLHFDSKWRKRRLAVALILFACLELGLLLPSGSAQQPESGDKRPQSQAGSGTVAAAASDLQPRKGGQLDSTVRIGPGDEVDITVFGLPELSQHVRVGGAGDVSLPLVGNLHFAGKSSDEAQSMLEKLLADGHFVNNPHASVYVKEYTTEGISLVGEVSRPGVYPALGAHRLLDVIQAAGGLTDKAGRTVTVSHRDDPTKPIKLTFSDDAVKMAVNNIELLPGDTIVVARGGIVYLVGEVNRPGGFVIEGNRIMASQLLAMAAGPTRMASLNRARIIRRTPEGLKDMPLALTKILQAKTPDVPLEASDIVYVPESRLKGVMGASNIVGLLAGAAIYRL
jgi:polysaccharide biosynthesis/export protein